MDSQERFENMVGLVEAHQYEWAIWQAARRGEPDGQPVVDAMQAYLRQCRVGGMSKEVSDQIERAVKQASHLGYFAAPTPERAQSINQCDGCQVKAPVTERGNHTMPDGGYMGCTANRYAPERAQESAGVRRFIDPQTEQNIKHAVQNYWGAWSAEYEETVALLAANKEPQP